MYLGTAKPRVKGKLAGLRPERPKSNVQRLTFNFRIGPSDSPDWTLDVERWRLNVSAPRSLNR